ncbi:MAG TPA: HAD hydrolase family protein [Terriglobales bacterium]|jgi:3-deoxy-D-manno-octulosonate 8-phosphate phosphatase (KDO 8-P phosphatase)
MDDATVLNHRHTPDAIARARAIELVLFDVDGVLTDGRLWYFPSGESGLVEVKGFSAHDGIGIGLARRAGLQTGVVTKRRSLSVERRARDLRLNYVHQGVDRKYDALQAIWKESGLGPRQTCAMGDDIVDLPMLEHAGLAAAPANARPEVLAAAHFVSAHHGGEGAARDLIEFILVAKGIWEKTLHQYLTAPESDYAGAATAEAAR